MEHGEQGQQGERTWAVAPDEAAGPPADPPPIEPAEALGASGAAPRPLACPGCATDLAVPAGVTRVRCERCAWEGEVYLFDPVVIDPEAPADALPDDATCAHHPDKQAADVCAGTGDYICSLCAVELGGAVYSVEYVNRVGASSLGHHLERHLNRPDRTVLLLLVLALVPCFWFLGPVLVIVAAVHYVRMLRQYRDDPLYRMVVGTPTLVAAPLLLVAWCGIYGLIGLAWLTGA